MEESLKRKRRRSEGCLQDSRLVKKLKKKRRSVAVCENNVSLLLQEDKFGSLDEEVEDVEHSEGHCEADEGQEVEGEDDEGLHVEGEDGEGLKVEGEGEGPADEVEEGEEGSTKPKKSHHIQGLYKPPTHDELQTLKETQNLFKSNLMKLQIAELLQEVKPKKKVASSRQLEEILRLLRETLLSLPSTPQVNLCEGLALIPGKVKYPLHFSPENSKGKFKFGPPSGVRVVGSYLLGTLTKPDLSVDLELSLPEGCLQVKDILNYRYFHKRALYLSILAGHLRRKRKSLSLKAVHFEYFGENPLLPILSLTLEGKQLSKYKIYLHTSVLDPSFFKQNKLAPDRNSVRRSFLSATSNQPDQPDESDVGCPTPHYNAALLVELGARERHLREMFVSAQECPAMVDAVVLFKVWARQRGLSKGYGGFSGFLFSMVVSALVARKKINSLMSCYQVFRVVLQQLVSSDWTTRGFHSSPDPPAQPPLEVFHAHYPVVFVDSSGLLNLCAELSSERYRWVQHEASLALQFLDDPTSCGFQALFMTPLPVQHKFDVLCHVSLSDLSPSHCISDVAAKEGVCLDGYAWPLPRVLERMMPVLQRGLDKRVSLVAPVITSCHTERLQWLSTKKTPDPNTGHVTLGLLLDTNCAFSILTMGPPADSAEAVEFRSFWGKKSELRRFEDGAINEAVLWVGKGVGSRESVQAKKLVCCEIIRHLLHRHFSVPVLSVSCHLNYLDTLLSDPSTRKSHESLLLHVQEAFTQLGKDLRGLRDIPLAVTSLQATSPSFRHTEVFASIPWSGKILSKLQATPSGESQADCYYPSCDCATPPLVPVHPVVCQLESSGKWPEELEALRKLKVAFYVWLAKALQEQKHLLSSPTEHHLDILKSGHVFRVRIHHQREVLLLRERLKEDGVCGDETRRGKEELAAAHRDMVALPVLTSTLNGLHQQYPAFGGGARLCKRWVSSHLLSNHISDEALELMVAYLFTNPAPYTTPSTDVVVFTRFLSLLSSHNWDNDPLLLNFNKEWSDNQISDICSEFSKIRSSLPPVVIVTSREGDQRLTSSPWTSSSHPSAPVLHRMQQLAREALSVLSSRLLAPSPISKEDTKLLFRTPLEDFDLLIHLNRKQIPLARQAVDATATRPHPNRPHTYTHFPVVDFDPVQLYLKELEAAYSDFALFFYDKYGGAYIAVLWIPQAFSPQPFKVGKAHCKVPVKGKRSSGKKKGVEVVPDTEAIIADFYLMGEGLVRCIEPPNTEHCPPKDCMEPPNTEQ